MLTRFAYTLMLLGFTLLALSPSEEAWGKAAPTGCRLAQGKIDMPGNPVYDVNGIQVATKRVTILWRYHDLNCDGVMSWGVGPAEGADYIRVVPRTSYDFTAAVAPGQDLNRQVQLSTHHFGPLDPALGPGRVFRNTALREIHHDDFIPGQPAPGDMIVTQGTDGLPVPGLSLAVHLFTDAGDRDFVPGTVSKWGARYVLTFDPAVSNGTIPAGTYMFMDTQLNAYNIVPDANGDCELGFSEEEWMNVNGGGLIQAGPNTANTTNPRLVPIPVHFAPQCANNTIP